ncbi:acetyltransferase family protein [Burkholderia pseudomallei MSHR2451]|uniref:GNAT family N-acetyltransferase n=1 Tax=Burkholderia pseudomallei TaxID=28450 RepID=UPI000538A925|nr:GNAT family N-acetyltransferase [Burkholderia pseudomallei]KGW36399.1 acetyltransferase family protein [Burkholderia pseudomallei MSHR2451]
MTTTPSIALRKISDLEAEQLVEFRCGSDDLDGFLANSAHSYSIHGLTQTVVAFAGSDPNPAAFFSLSADGLPLSASEQFELGLPFECQISYFPAVKITKLAVRQEMQSNGLGSDLIKIIEGMAFLENVAVRLLTVDAINTPKAIAFYQRNGFRTSSRHDLRQQKVKKKRKIGVAHRPQRMRSHRQF